MAGKEPAASGLEQRGEKVQPFGGHGAIAESVRSSYGSVWRRARERSKRKSADEDRVHGIQACRGYGDRMPKVIFEADTHPELVAQVKRWLASLNADDDGTITVTEAISQGAELTKDALRIIAGSAPKPIAQNEVVRALTDMGYKATDATKERLVEGLGSVEQLTGGSVLKQVSERGRSAVYEMNVTIAKQILKQLHGQ